MQKFDCSNSTAFWSTGRDFYYAALLVNNDRANPEKRDEILYPMVGYYLICHSIEATLKGFLRGKGYTISQLRKIGHDLEKAVSRAKKEGIDQHFKFSVEFMTDLRKVNFYYAKKDFEYLLASIVDLPATPDLPLENAGLLLPALWDFCAATSNVHTDKESAHNPRVEEEQRIAAASVSSV